MEPVIVTCFGARPAILLGPRTSILLSFITRLVGVGRPEGVHDGQLCAMATPNGQRLHHLKEISEVLRMP
ncbi:hypothetical protein PGT21_019152 [Puccinia graminis f. sp. tritici]|uniref:Uncharacterized protein n=1 Tax=Puccinia graminis f. sp. tritici TaxID=56615 RepID=A0A5B0PAF9_PUCGR|nr:hypothetical protein PGT21_019152 [Puccinia graminis f. sp. tritici]KAA1126009.1 hypothetical protein PGTUg99_011072 [Puccinia graminis f. sp. tritici]